MLRAPVAPRQPAVPDSLALTGRDGVHGHGGHGNGFDVLPRPRATTMDP
ncbi:hypothetical protein [Luteimicrobium album]|nr:hypothetical protein [Luteimicrobium album]